MKPPYEIAVEKFIENWEHKKDVVGAVICGSYVTGNPSKHSDIDVQIILNEKVKWRERGNKIVDGFLIEYFANPGGQNLKYFEKDFKRNRKIQIHMLTTGKVILDKNGDVKKLIKEAEKWDKKKFTKSNKFEIEINKYHIWDMLDNLEEVYEEKEKDFYYVYYNFLSTLLDSYSRFIGFNSINANKVRRFLSDKKDQKKYKMKNFPDKTFVKMYLKAMELSDKSNMISNFKQISEYVMKKMGGFNIDGWKIKSEVEK